MITITGKIEHQEGCEGEWVQSFAMGGETEYDLGYRCSLRCGAEVHIHEHPDDDMVK